jgi:hypothetical protein
VCSSQKGLRLQFLSFYIFDIQKDGKVQLKTAGEQVVHVSM